MLLAQIMQLASFYWAILLCSLIYKKVRIIDNISLYVIKFDLCLRLYTVLSMSTTENHFIVT